MADDSAPSEILTPFRDVSANINISLSSTSGSDATVDDVNTHIKLIGFATTEGQDYEVKMAALLFARALNSKGEFQLATNVAGAGALDDIVFQFTTPDQVCHTAFIQLKHKKSAKVYFDQLVNQKGDFSLSKYFEAFMDIKQSFEVEGKGLFSGSFESCYFGLFTNAPLHQGKGGVETCDLPSPVDVYINLNDVKASFTEVFLEKLYLDIMTEEDKQKKPSKYPITSNEDDAKDFMRRFKLFTGQPSEDQLDDVIKEELKKFWIGKKDLNTAFRFFLERMKSWWQHKVGIILNQRSTILLEAHAEAMLPHIQNLSRKTNTKFKLDIKFLESSTAAMKGACANQLYLVHVPSQQLFRMTASKVLQTLEPQRGKYIFLSLESLLKEREAVLLSWRHGKNDLLVLVCIGTTNQEKEIVAELSQVLEEKKYKKLILISDSSDSFATQFKEKMIPSVKTYPDSFHMSQLDPESIVSILQKKVVLQGTPTSLGAMIGEDLDRITKELKDVLETIIASESLVIGGNLEEDIEYYVPRTMQCKNIVSNNILSDKNYAGRIIIHGATPADVDVLVPNREHRVRKKFQQISEDLEFNAYCDLQKEIERIMKLFRKNRDKVNKDGESVKAGDKDRNKNEKRETEEVLITKEAQQVCNEENRDRDTNTRNDVHYFDWLEGKLFWKETRGDINFINKYIDDKWCTTGKPTSRVVLLIAEPGMGKSTLLTHEAQQVKAAHPGSWVVCVALNDHATLLAKVKKGDLNAEQFLSSALGLDSVLERALLSYSMNHTGRIIALLDAFDEISPRYTDECLTLIDNIRNTRIDQIWISSRFSMKKKLETRLSTLALTLRKFTVEDQRLFLEKYWGASTCHSSEVIQEYISRLLDLTAQSMNDKERDFTGIPLQTRMLAEVFQDSITNVEAIILPVALNVLQLIEKFVGKKFETFFKKTIKLDESSAEYENEWEEKREIFIKKHITASLLVLFDESDLQSLHSLDARKSDKFIANIEKGVDKTGIIDRVVDGKPVFLHRVFAEYFAALWFSEHYHSNAEFMSKHLLSETFCVVRHMFDRILARDNDLHNAVLNSDEARVDDLLRGGSDVNSTDKGGRTALHLAVMAGLHNPSGDKANIPIIQLLMTHNARVDVKDKVLQWSSVQYADASKLWAEIDTLLSHTCIDITQFITTKHNIADKDIWEIMVLHDYANVLSLLLDISQTQVYQSRSVSNERSDDNSTEFMKPESLLLKSAEYGSTEVARLLIDRTAGVTLNAWDGPNKRNALMISSEYNHMSVVKIILEAFNNHSDLSEYINTRDEHGKSALLCASSRGHNAICDLLISNGADVTARDKYGWTGLMIASIAGHVTVVRSLLAPFNDESKKAEYVNTCDDEGESALLLAISGGLNDIFDHLIANGADVTARDKYGNTGLMEALRAGNVSLVRSLLATFNDENKKAEYVNACNSRGQSALRLANRSGHNAIIDLLRPYERL